MEVARSKGQMLRRRELDKSLREPQAGCGNDKTPLDLRARIQKQEKYVIELQRDLQRAEEELVRLRNEKP